AGPSTWDAPFANPSRVAVPTAANAVELSQIGLEPRAKALKPLAIRQPQLGREVVVVEQADVVDPAGERLGRLDLDPPVALQTGGSRDQLADDDVLLEAV